MILTAILFTQEGSRISVNAADVPEVLFADTGHTRVASQVHESLIRAGRFREALRFQASVQRLDCGKDAVCRKAQIAAVDFIKDHPEPEWRFYKCAPDHCIEAAGGGILRVRRASGIAWALVRKPEYEELVSANRKIRITTSGSVTLNGAVACAALTGYVCPESPCTIRGCDKGTLYQVSDMSGSGVAKFWRGRRGILIWRDHPDVIPERLF